MNQRASVKIRGIYTTALTKLLLDQGYSIVQPSMQIRDRFLSLEENETEPDILIRDRRDHQAILISGNREQIEMLLSLFNAWFFDMVIRPGMLESHIGREFTEVEFPGISKESLDHLRAMVMPTVKRHHLLRIIDSEELELAETELGRLALPQEESEQRLWQRLVLKSMRDNGFIEIVHVRPEGEVLNLRGGRILSLENSNLVIKREFAHGHGIYDGLNLPIEEGDYSITRITEKSWFLTHSYYSKERIFKGRYFNINTPIEFYPDEIRYVDLHIDLVQKPGTQPVIIDQEKLDKVVASGFISRQLAEKANQVALSIVSSPTDNCSDQ